MYVPLNQIHDIEFAPSLDYVLKETLPVLEEAVKSGKAKFIGITGYPLSTLATCVERSQIPIDIVLTYSRFSFIDDSLMEFLPYFKVIIIKHRVHFYSRNTQLQRIDDVSKK